MTTKEQVIKANEAYRKGTPIMSDAEYDVLLSKLENEMDFIEFEIFKQTLMEESGEYKHQYVIGSLNKVRYGENELSKWLKKHNVKELVVSEKLDGCSFTANYIMGKFISGASRGDGSTGTDWTEKLKYILPQTISIIDSVTIRGELVITDNKHLQFGYKNARNGVVGIMGEDRIVPEKLNAVTAIVYDMPSTKLTSFQIFQELDKEFTTPKWIILDVKDTVEEDLKSTLEVWKACSPYLMDGLVISTKDYVNENVYHPERKVAFKVNSEGVISTVKGIEWNVGKTGAIKPVVIVNPVEIDGTTVQRVSGYNYQYIRINGIGVGAEVSIIKSGDIIPKIINVVKKGNNPDFPDSCLCCDAPTEVRGVDLICINPECDEKLILRLNSFLRNCGVENASEASLRNWGIFNFNDLVGFKPHPNYKSQISFEKELKDKVFNKNTLQLFANMYFEGAGSTTINKIIDFFGWEIANKLMLNQIHTKKFPEGVGWLTMEKAKDDWRDNLETLKILLSDSRFSPVVEVKQEFVEDDSFFTGKSFCITGTLSKPRKYWEDLIVKKGGKIGSVSKNLDYLIVGADAGGKLDKAEKLGINIIEANYFEEMI